ncbi:UDP-3-O-(3-hydroxymyristoyl)glucosamine N-acyltransferase [bacterium]|nr:UDP-3-O-(3-hydroxymyristoyl)glucosamine N-acyltransferase [bacterium]
MAPPRITTGELAALLGGELVGDPAAVVDRFASSVAEAGPGAIAFINNRKYYKALRQTKATLVLVPRDIDRSSCPKGVSMLVLEDPYLALARGMQMWFRSPRAVTGVSERAFVSPTAKLGKDVNVFPFAFVGDGAELGDRVDVHPFSYVGPLAQVGADTILYAGAVLYAKTRVGARCIVHSGAVLGSDGFGFAPDKKTGEHVKIPQVGIAVIEDDVEVGASTTIDRAAFDETRIGRGTKIDNLVQIGHNARVGRGCFLVAQSGIAGTTRVGDFVTIAAQAGLVGHIQIGNGATIAAQSGVTEDVGPGKQVVGTPAVEGKQGLRYLRVQRHLPELRSTVRRLEKRILELERRLGLANQTSTPGPERDAGE